MPVLFGGGEENESAPQRAVNRLRYAISRVAVYGSAGQRQAYLVQLLAPSLHAAWVRTQLTKRAESGGDKAAGGSVLTVRELDILKWIYLGKSNFEIGAILKISPLTVKNHVQKILRKLNVVNRTQAIGKSLELRILNP